MEKISPEDFRKVLGKISTTLSILMVSDKIAEIEMTSMDVFGMKAVALKVKTSNPDFQGHEGFTMTMTSIGEAMMAAKVERLILRPMVDPEIMFVVRPVQI